MGSLRSGPVVCILASILFLLQPVQPEASRRASEEQGRADELKLLAWLDAVVHHTPGELDAQAVFLSGHDWADLTTVLGNVCALRRRLSNVGESAVQVRIAGVDYDEKGLAELLGLTPKEVREGEFNRLFDLAAVAHADVAMLAPAAWQNVVDQSRVVVQTIDGRQDALLGGSLHWEFARAVIDAMGPEAERRPFVRTWYLATTAFLQKIHFVTMVRDHLAAARRIFPADPDVLFASACIAETLASDAIQAAARAARMPTPRTQMVVPPAVRLRKDAVQFFKQVLDLVPDHVEARVRLGRLLGELGRHQEAADEQRRVLASQPDALLAYYAHLFLGEEEEVMGHPDTANAEYDEAARLFPAAQSPHLARAHLARRIGDLEGALAFVSNALNAVGDPETAFDPWHTFYFLQGQDAGIRVAAMYAELKAGGQ